MKKKVIPLILGVSMMLTTPIHAMDVDVSSMEMNELLELRQAVETELISRLESGSATINPGVYKVGEDIKAANFNITFDDWADVALFTDEEAYKKAVEEDSYEDNALSVQSVSEGESCFVGLKEGMVLLIHHSAGIVTDAEKSTWAVE